MAAATSLPRHDKRKRGGAAALPKSLPIATLQILPKLASQSFRPIAMFKSKRHASNRQLKANLKICLMVRSLACLLNHPFIPCPFPWRVHTHVCSPTQCLQAVIDKERERVTGAGITAIADAADKLVAWKKEACRRSHQQQGEDSLFLVKVDISKAFDNLRHDLIMEAVRNALDELKHPSILLVTFLVTSPKPWHRFQPTATRKKIVCLPSDLVPFPELAKQVGTTDKARCSSLSLSLCVCVCVCKYMHIYVRAHALHWWIFAL